MPENKNDSKPHPLVTAVADTIAHEKMLQPGGDRVLVGVSGGADSVALLHILYRLSISRDLDIGVAHLNHALRGSASDGDAAFVQTVARQLDLPCFCTRQDVGLHRQKEGGSLEEAGRRARYRFYEQTAKMQGFTKIALGHHADDTAELVLMNLLRGSGSKGIAGIPPTRAPGIIRPLIHARRRDILSYIKDNNLPFVVDASNQDPRFFRNKVRNELMPALSEAYNPRLTEALVRTASISRTEEEWLEQLTRPMVEAAILATRERSLTLSTVYLSELHLAAARRVVRSALKILNDDLNGITLQHVDATIDLVFKGSDQRELHLPGQLRIRRQGPHLSMTKEDYPLRSNSRGRETGEHCRYNYEVRRPTTQVTSVLIKETGQELAFSAIKNKSLSVAITGRQASAFFDMEELEFPLVLRNYRIGDQFTPLGMQGSQKVKKFFINAKIARAQRKTCPILLSRGRIIWVVGHRMDDRFKIGPATRNVLKVELLLA